MTTRTRIMYLFRENHELEVSIPALSTNSGDSPALGGISRTVVASEAPASALLDSSFLGDGTNASLEVSGALCVGTTGTLAIEGAAAANEGPAGFDEGSEATPLDGLRAAGCGLNCPRHFFSSHSTQSTRPAEIGNPQASHFRSPRSTGGTWLWSASPS